MKRIILLILILTVWAFSQGTVKTMPQPHDWLRIYDGVLGDYGNQDTTSAFAIKGWDGVVTLVIETDTTGASVLVANQSDSCLTVYLQLYRKYIYPANQVTEGDWMSYYSSTDVNKIKIDTVARSFVNAVGNTLYMNPAVKLNSNGEWSWADSARFILSIGTGDSLTAKIDVGGQ
jgi:hypothetical protein